MNNHRVRCKLIYVVPLLVLGGGAFMFLYQRLRANDVLDPKPVPVQSASFYYKSQSQIDFMDSLLNDDINQMKTSLLNGAAVNCVGECGMRPLLWTLLKKRVLGFEFLLDHKADPNFESGVLLGEMGNFSLLDLTTINRDSAYLKALLSHGVDPNTVNKETHTPLFTSILFNNYDNFLLLLNNKADLDLKDFSGGTAMMLASSIHKYKFTHKLLLVGANPTIKDRWGDDLASLMKKFPYDRIVQEPDNKKYYEAVIQILKERGLY